jgi:radical SAM superfamily enzyme YgiQ (UPF0313 family)
LRILLLYPQYPDTFWSFKYSISFIKKKALMPPLGLATIAAMLPKNFEVRLVDMNIEELRQEDLLWADFVFISAMITQKDSAHKVVRQCKDLGAKTVAGGPLFSSLSEEFPEIDHFVLDEGEVTFPMFLEDLQKGELKRYYRSDVKPDLKTSPVPRWDIFKMDAYVRMPIQYSRGCPFDCEFCDVVRLNGKVPRTKSPEQVIRELDALLDAGWKRHIFFVDDNFIGDKKNSKALLKAIADWKKRRPNKATFMTEVSLNVADDPELMEYLRNAGFNSLFIGLETPSEESLAECGKFQNKNRNIIESLKTLYRNGFEVSAGFIVGFDHDDPSIFKRQIDFIQQSGVVIAMVGLLQALPGTRLYERLKRENRLIADSSGNNTDFSINFVPKLDSNMLIDGYKQIVNTVYSKKEYYDRVLTFIKNYNHRVDEHFSFDCLFALFKSIIYMGILDESRRYYWRTFFISLLKYRQNLPKFIIMSIYYAHFKRVLVDYSK